MNRFRKEYGINSLQEMKRVFDLHSPSLVETGNPLLRQTAPVYAQGGPKSKGRMESPQGVDEYSPDFVGPVLSKSAYNGPEVPYGFYDAPIDWERKKALQHYNESSFKANQVSPAGAMGPYQIMPKNWETYSKKLGLTGTAQDYNNSEAVRDRMMEELLQAKWVNKGFPSDSVRAAKALMGYNWGSGNATRFLENMKNQGVDIYHSMDWIDKIPSKETKNYVNYILRERNIPGGKTIEAFERALPHRFDAYPEAKKYDMGGPEGYLWDPINGIVPEKTPEYVGGILEPAVVAAQLPAKFNGSQASARRYAEGYKWGRENVRNPREEAAPYVAKGMAATMLAPELISLGAANAPAIGTFLKNMAIGIPAFETFDRLPTLWGDDRFTVQGGNLLERGFRAITPNGEFENKVAPYVNQAGQVISGLPVGGFGEAATRGAAKGIVKGLGKAAQQRAAKFAELLAPMSDVLNTGTSQSVKIPADIRYSEAALRERPTIPNLEEEELLREMRIDQLGVDVPIITNGPNANVVTQGQTPAAPTVSKVLPQQPMTENTLQGGYQIARYPGGYMRKSLMSGNPLEKQIGKNGTVNVNNVKALINKGSKVEQAVVDKVLASEQFAGKKAIDYNQFRKAVQDELITYERTPDTRFADYGMESIHQGITGSPNLRRIVLNAKTHRMQFSAVELYGTKEERNSVRKLTHDLREGKISESEYDEKFNSIYNEFSDRITGNATPETFTFSSPRIPQGEAKHYDANTLGHSRTYTTFDEPDVLHVMESQSDWAQSGSAASAKKAYQKNVERLGNEYTESRKRVLEKAKADVKKWKEMMDTGLRENGDKLEPYEIAQVQDYYFSARDRLARLETEMPDNYVNLSQAEYLSDNFTTRQIQENLRYAAEKGQKKMRYPTRETAAEIEGYQKSRGAIFEQNPELQEKYNDFMAFRQQKVNDVIKEYAPEGFIDDYLMRIEEMPEEVLATMDAEQIADLQRRSKLSWDFEKSEAGSEMKKKINEVYRKYDEHKWLEENIPGTYLPQHETILRKYDAFPKQYQKLFKKAEVRTVTDPKGNTWYEVDVPENYLQQEWTFESGGFLNNILRNGGNIHIKPSHRGKFTALKKRTGHSASWFKAHGTPAQKKMAVFALNAKHWGKKKAYGGIIF